jgi:hypothetical protein
MTANISQASLTEDILQDVYTSDQDMYPAPLSLARLKSWVEACPELSICFRASDNQNEDVAVGVVIVLPLVKKYWEELLVGKVKETDVDAAVVFPKPGEYGLEVGLHVFHIERFEAWPKVVKKRTRFAEYSLQAIEAVAATMGWKTVGYSGKCHRPTNDHDALQQPDDAPIAALTATPAGRATFTRLGFSSTGYEEHFLRDDAGGINMVCVYPGMRRPLELAGARDGSGDLKSEMLVRRAHDSAVATNP